MKTMELPQSVDKGLEIKKSFKKISVKQIKSLGYKLTDSQIPLGTKPYKFGILELKNESDNKEVSFCMLYSTEDKMGIILPNSFNYYLIRPNACYEALR